MVVRTEFEVIAVNVAVAVLQWEVTDDCWSANEEARGCFCLSFLHFAVRNGFSMFFSEVLSDPLSLFSDGEDDDNDDHDGAGDGVAMMMMMMMTMMMMITTMLMMMNGIFFALCERKLSLIFW